MLSLTIICLGLALGCLVLVQLCAFVVEQTRSVSAHRVRFEWDRANVVARTSSLQQQALQAATAHPAWKGWRALRVVETCDESADCRSFYLQPLDGSPLPPFRPGQYVTVAVMAPDNLGMLISRCYSLSDAPDPRYWRITVKRLEGGTLSERLHNEIVAGDELLVGAPAGRFVPDLNDQRPLTLIAAGVGITPMVAMVRYGLTWQPNRPIHLFFQARDKQHAPLLKPLQQWAAISHHFQLTTCFSQPQAADDADIIGRLDVASMLDRGATAEGEFFICGPVDFMQSIRQDLLAKGIPPDAVHIESFGRPRKTPGERTAGVNAETLPTDAPPSAGKEKGRVSIKFARSDRATQCHDDRETLLEAAERSDASIPSGCRAGECGSCVVRLLQGTVRYDQAPSEEFLGDGEALACVARPSSDVVVDA